MQIQWSYWAARCERRASISIMCQSVTVLFWFMAQAETFAFLLSSACSSKTRLKDVNFESFCTFDIGLNGGKSRYSQVLVYRLFL
ncbi:hypothetical protein CPB84DRAFT_1417628 [Gymnopilus junonius]|uniref:Uncharacterized protein n=1 Tax=Gymnopilus junonius TaxID=109634 RepID=A0A9P5TKS4_GYMJU|nr:hypothetical protein CPB84DRAFT_1417628 [Gymnopilus junonius]